jgi:hypothetical protein
MEPLWLERLLVISGVFFWLLMGFGTYALIKMHRETGGLGFGTMMAGLKMRREMKRAMEDGDKKND